MPDQLVRTEIRGLRETQAKMTQVVKDLQGGPMLDGMRQATLIVLADAKRLAPVDTGRLRASITPEVRQQSNVIQGVVGSNVAYAPCVETGTRPHWPPPGALAVWARRHGMSEALIRFIIGTRGTKKHPYLQPALEKNVSRIVNLIGATVGRIVTK